MRQESQFQLEGNATKWFDPKWGMTVGVRLENKNMTTEATVKITV